MIRFVTAPVLVLLICARSLGADEPVLQPTAEQILKRWRAAAATTERLDVTFARFIYDETFKTTKTATGRLYMERSGRCHIRLEPSTQLPVSTRRDDTTGKPYTIKPDDANTFIWLPDKLLLIDPDRKTCNQICFTNAAANEHHDAEFGGFFQFIANGMRAYESAFLCKALDDNFLSEFLVRFDVSVSQNKASTVLQATPMQGDDARHIKLLKLAFSKSSAFPAAMSTVDPAGTKEIVVVFGTPTLNDVPRDTKQLFDPNLEGFAVRTSRPADNEK